MYFYLYSANRKVTLPVFSTPFLISDIIRLSQWHVITNNSNNIIRSSYILRDYLDYWQVRILMTGEITAEITFRAEKHMET